MSNLLKSNKKLVNEWDYEKNKDIDIINITDGSSKNVWWKCDKGHSYSETIYNRVKRNNGCPYCSNHRILKGYNDFATKFPHLLNEWDYEKNDELDFKINNFTKGNDTKVWWKCPKGHEWQASVSHIVKGTRCPYCANNKILKGFNDLKTTNPELLEEWDYEKNIENGINPENITKSYSKKVWWKCPKGHSYQSYVYNKRNGYGKCPYCKKEKFNKSTE